MTKLLKLDFLYSENQQGGAFNFLNPSSATTVLPETDVLDNVPSANVGTSVELNDSLSVGTPDTYISPIEPLSSPPSTIDVAPVEPPSLTSPDTYGALGDSLSSPPPIIDVAPVEPPSLTPSLTSPDTYGTLGDSLSLPPPMIDIAPVEPPSLTSPDTYGALGDSVSSPPSTIDVTPPTDAEFRDLTSSTSSTMGSIPLPSSEPPAMDLMQADSSIIETPITDSTIVDSQPNIFLEPPVDNNLYSNDLSPEISSDSTLWEKIKGAFKWTFTSIFSFPTLIVIFIIILTIVLIFIYNLYKNNSIKLPQSIERFIVTIKTFFTNMYNKILNINDTPKDTKKNKQEKKYFDSDTNDDTEETEKNSNDSILNKITKEEVFNIDKNLFTYEEAEHVCKKFNSKLATEAQVKKAWENGANWCNYGWSQGKKALYPIQKEFYNKLKLSNSKNKNQCGYPGINGGTLNPRLKLGVNCYGVKPKKNIINECNDVKVNLDKKLKQIREDLEINKFNSNKLSQHS